MVVSDMEKRNQKTYPPITSFSVHQAACAMIDTVDDAGFDSQSPEFWETALMAGLRSLGIPTDIEEGEAWRFE